MDVDYFKQMRSFYEEALRSRKTPLDNPLYKDQSVVPEKQKNDYAALQ